MNDTNKVVVQLTEPTVFPDLNKKESKAEDYARSTLVVDRLKYKHFRQMQNLRNEEQLQFALMTLTGLSENDLDELYAEDAAELTSVVYGFMNKYLVLAKKMMEQAG